MDDVETENYMPTTITTIDEYYHTADWKKFM